MHSVKDLTQMLGTVQKRLATARGAVTRLGRREEELKDQLKNYADAMKADLAEAQRVVED